MPAPEKHLPKHIGWAYIIAALLCLLAGLFAALSGASEEWRIFAVSLAMTLLFGIVAILHRFHEMAERRRATRPPDDDGASS